MTMDQDVGASGSDRAQSGPKRVRARAHAKGITYALSPCEKKTIDIESLLYWAYAREKVHLARPQGIGLAACPPPGGARDSTLAIGGGGGAGNNLGFEAPADAYAVKRAVDGLGPGRARLVQHYAIAGCRPDWTPRPMIWAEPGASGNCVHIDRKNRRYVCAFRLFTYRGDLPEIVASRRRRYAMWAQAVGELGRELRGVLSAFTLSGDPPPPCPWEAD